MIVTITAGLLSKSAGMVLEKILDQLLDLDEVESILVPEQYCALVVPKYAALPVVFSTDDFAGQIKQCVEGASAEAQIRNMPVLCLNADFLLDMDVVSAWKRRNLVFCCAASFNEGCAFATHRVGGITCREGMGNVVTEVLLDAAAPLQMCGVIGFEVLEDVYEYIELQQPNSTAAECVAGMMRDSVTFQAQIIPRAASFCLATETLCQEYELGFLFDLDGTLVQTDDIYTSVWNGLLRQYGLAVDHAFFDHFIRGKSDFAFLRFLMPSISEAEVRDMSVKKDEEFILALSAEQEDVVNVGAREFMERASNSRVAVVTSCNKSAAEYILKKTGLGEYCSLIISADDCVKHKPHPEPYLRAMKLLGLGPDSCVAFEDSLSGYWSAKHSRPRRVCVFTGLKAGCSEEIQKLDDNDDAKFDNYYDLEYESVVQGGGEKGPSEMEKCAYLIKKKLGHMPLKSVTFSDEKLKTGYICDINSFHLNYNNGCMEKIVLKMSNYGNELANVAVQLDMYEIEAFFYDSLSLVVADDILIPKSYGTIRDGRRVGILLEDLRRFQGVFNVDLNCNVECLLRVTRDIHRMHSKYTFNKNTSVLPVMQSLKTVRDITYYRGLVEERFEKFYQKNTIFFTPKSRDILLQIRQKFPDILAGLSSYPLSFCHGDLKSPNIFYKDGTIPYFLDWQYAHLNKGVSDVVFMLVESVVFDAITCDLVEKFYFRLEKESNKNYTYDEHMYNFKLALCMFPFFVTVWFNSEDGEKLLDRTFPLKFMKNLLNYYEYYLDMEFFELLGSPRKPSSP